MTLTTLKQALDHANKNGYALGAFNVNNLEQVQAVIRAADAKKSPVIVQMSSGAVKYGGPELIAAIHYLIAKTKVPIVLHLDHGSSYQLCKEAIDLGFSSVMIDASLLEDHKTPSDYKYNKTLTKKVVRLAHSKGVSVEAEIGTIGGAEENIAAREIILTEKDVAKKFIDDTKIDALAVAIGTSHGAYKFDKPCKLAIKRCQEIKDDVKIPLVLHGASSVPQNIVKKINKFGGDIKKTYGTSISEIKRAVKAGINKVNVDTDSRLTIAATIREIFIKKPEVFDLRKYMGPARDQMQKLIEGKMDDFGSSSKAVYKVISLEKIKDKFY